MKSFYDYGNGVVLGEERVGKIVDEITTILKTELPGEAQCPIIVENIIDEVKNKLRYKHLSL